MQLVLQFNEQVTTTSMIIADRFGKRHADVLKDIENLKCSKEFRERNFALSSYKSSQNRNLPIFYITKDGFSFLVMGFTGELAGTFKEAFIEQFNKMEQALKSASTPNLIPTYQLRILSEPAKSCPPNRWCIFKECHSVMLAIETNVGSVNKFDLVDGSIGIHWMKYREGKPWAKTVSQYWHEFKDKRGKQLANCFDYAEIAYFNHWLENIYRPTHLPNYLITKFKGDKLMYTRVQAFVPKLLSQRAS